jgi:uncharacterized membrane protein YfcA
MPATKPPPPRLWDLSAEPLDPDPRIRRFAAIGAALLGGLIMSTANEMGFYAIRGSLDWRHSVGIGLAGMMSYFISHRVARQVYQPR